MRITKSSTICSYVRRVAAVAFSAVFAINSAFTLTACKQQLVSADSTPAHTAIITEKPTTVITDAPATEELQTPFEAPTCPPATAVPVVGEYTKSCKTVTVDFPETDNTRAFSISFDLPEGWTVKSDEGVYPHVSYQDYCLNLLGRMVFYDENGELVGATGFESYAPEDRIESGLHGVYAYADLGHVTFVNWDYYNTVEDDSSNCESAYSASNHSCSPNDWTVGEGFHPYCNPVALSYTTDNPVFIVIELSCSYEDSASLSKRIAESIRFVR